MQLLAALLLFILPLAHATAVNLFKEYLTRGLYSCTANYVKTLTDIHTLMKAAAEEYNACSHQMKGHSKSYEPTEFESLNELLDEWKQAEVASSPAPELASSTPSLSSSASQEDLSLRDSSTEEELKALKGLPTTPFTF